MAAKKDNHHSIEGFHKVQRKDKRQVLSVKSIKIYITTKE